MPTRCNRRFYCRSYCLLNFIVLCYRLHCVVLSSFCCYCVVLLFVLFCYHCVVLCIDLCTVTLPPGVNPIAVDKYIYYIISTYICFGHHYAHHQELESSIQVAAAAARKPDTQPSAPHHTDNLKTKAPNTTGSDHLYNTLELLMMGIVLPETC